MEVAMKRNGKNYAIVILLVIITLGVVDNIRYSNMVEELESEKEKLSNEIVSLEKKLEDSADNAEKVENENNRLVESVAQLEELVDSLKTVDYQEFMEAMGTVEAYKAAEGFEEAREAMSTNVSIYMTESEGPCSPCGWGFGFNRHHMDWKPNTFQELREFTIEREKILLTYNTIDELKHDYQFVVSKGEGWDSREGWKIQDVKLKAKNRPSN